jgi:hypothetical protein
VKDQIEAFKALTVLMGDVAATLQETSAKTALVISRFVYSTMLIEENLVRSVINLVVPFTFTPYGHHSGPIYTRIQCCNRSVMSSIERAEG